MKILSQVSQYSDLTTGYVYQWTNNINGTKYIGSHCGNRRGYTGSGTAFKAAVKKYGIKNFHRDILYVGTDFLDVEEQILVALDVKNNTNFYNLTNVAVSLGWDSSGQKNGMFGKKHSEQTKERQRQAALIYRKSDETKALIGAQTRERWRKKREATLGLTQQG